MKNKLLRIDTVSSLEQQQAGLNIKTNNTVENARKYACAGFDNTYHLGYRDIPLLLEKHTIGKRAIDYGCGAGRSTRFLKLYGFEPVGVDISKRMLQEAYNADDSTHYLYIKSGKIPVLNDSCDLVFSCFVFFTIATKKELFIIFKEIHRCLKEGGIFMIVTGSEYLYSHDWVSYNVDYPENLELKSGDRTKIQLKDLGVTFINYYWTENDYNSLFETSGFKLVEKHFPLGRIQDTQKWKSETKIPPYVVYVLQKK